MTTPRYYTKFSNAALNDEYQFPRNLYSCSIRQPLRTTSANVVGKHYGVRLVGTGMALKDFAEITVRFVAQSNEALEDAKSKMFSYGLGYLHTSDSKKAKAELIAMPEISTSWDKPNIADVVLTFKVHEDFA